MNKLATYDNIDPVSFDAIAKLTYSESGLLLAVEKKSMIQSRLRHRLKALNLSDFAQYSAFVCSEKGLEERRQMISALTTNVSHFFREKHHFDLLESNLHSVLLPKLKSSGSVRIWSAGCSNGQEAMSIVMTLLEIKPELANMNLKVLATDIDPQVLEFAKNAKYPERMTTGIPTNLIKKYFTCGEDLNERVFTAKDCLKALISFKELNLLSDWPMRQAMDVIFCRNVLIYFDQETQNRLWPRFRDLLAPGGLLFLGHSERIPDPENYGFNTHGPTTYRRVN